VACYGFRNTAEEEAPQPRAPIRAQNNQVGIPFCGSIQNDAPSPVVTDVVTLKPAEENVLAARSATSCACGSRSSSSG
jgi:hypothetical protein